MSIRKWINLAILFHFLSLSGCSTFGPVTVKLKNPSISLDQESVRNNLIQVGRDGVLYEIPDQKVDPNPGESPNRPIDSFAGDDRLYKCFEENSNSDHPSTDGKTPDTDSSECQQALEEQLQVEDNVFSGLFNSIDRFFQGVSFDIENCPRSPRANDKHIVIYIHGGLNSRTSALKRAIKDAHSMKCEGIYPIFINWRTSVGTTLGDHYFRIRDGEIRTPLSRWTSPIYMAGSVVGSVGNAPIAWAKELNNSLVTSLPLAKTPFGTYRRLVADALNQNHIKNLNNLDIVVPAEDRGLSKRSLLWLLTGPVKIVTTPFVYTIGKSSWDQMLRRADTQILSQFAFLNSASDQHLYQRAKSPEVLSEVSKSYQGCEWLRTPSTAFGSTVSMEGATLKFACNFYRFINSENHRERLNYKVTLIGHSMGGIVINSLLQLFPEFPVDDIVYMASADTLANYVNTTIPLVERRQKVVKHSSPVNSNKTSENLAGGRGPVNVYSLFLHPDNEDREVSGWGTLPSGSLLVWIDGMFEQPASIDSRTSGRWTNMFQELAIVRNMTTLKGINNNFHFKVFPKCKNCNAPQKHGGFDDGIDICINEPSNYWDRRFWVDPSPPESACVKRIDH